MILEGILPALVTPFNDSGDVDLNVLERLVSFHIECGVHGFVPCGSTGEYYAMTAEERYQVLKCVKETAGTELTLIAGTNGGSTKEVIEHTESAMKLGYTAILLAPPYYSLPTQDELIEHYNSILDAVDVDLILYNFPPRTGVEISMDVLEEFRHNKRVIGIKESSGTLQRAIEIKTRFADDYQLSCGSDDIALDFFLWGAGSWICGPANCFTLQALKIFQLQKNKEYAEAKNVMQALVPAMLSLENSKFVQKVKYGCELNGIDVGTTRLPLTGLSDKEKKEFSKVFKHAQDF